jgi:hypothetical protein
LTLIDAASALGRCGFRFAGLCFAGLCFAGLRQKMSCTQDGRTGPSTGAAASLLEGRNDRRMRLPSTIKLQAAGNTALVSWRSGEHF